MGLLLYQTPCNKKESQVRRMRVCNIEDPVTVNVELIKTRTLPCFFYDFTTISSISSIMNSISVKFFSLGR